jgi:hypothetical protein
LKASQDLAAKDRRTRRAEPSVPGAHHVAGAEGTSNAVALSKDPRARHEAQRQVADSAKSCMAARVGEATSTEQEAAAVFRAENPEQPHHSLPPVGASDVGNENQHEADDMCAESPSVSIPEHSGGFFVVDRAPVMPRNDVKDPYDDPRKNVVDEEQPSRGPMASHAAAVAAALTTESRGIGVAPDVTYGTTRGGSNHENLAVAVAIEDGENERFLPAAIEYDPDSKPPLIKNRRFRLYIISGILLFVIVIITVILGVVVFKKQPGYGASDAPSLAPTSTMDAKYYQQFAQVLGYNDWSFTSDSPQGAAAQWIIEEDARNLDVDNETLTQRYLLAVFFYTTTQNGALSWRSCSPDPFDSTIAECNFQFYTILDNDTVSYVPEPSFRWMSGVDECSWAGIICNERNVLIAIQLGKCLASPNREELYSLTHYCFAVDSVGQNITGTIPTELAAFPLIQSLSLAFNQLTGTLPITFALPDSARQLLNLEVHGNYLTGTIPSEYFQATGLQNLNIGQNLLTGTLSTEIGRLTNLKGFHAFDNMLNGTFPTEIGRLEYLSFTRHQENQYTGTIPSELSELILLQELWMYSNQFTGTIPTELGKARSMVDLELNWNKLTGTIPTEIYQWTSLSVLDLFQNYLNGTIATEIGLLTNMKLLRLSRNAFTGTIPSEIVNLTVMELAWFHSNQFVGSVPSGLCKFVPKPLMILQSDCFPDGSSPNPCDCCTACCNRDTEICLVIDDNTAP